MATDTLNVTFDGTTAVPRLPGSSDVTWSGGTPSFMGLYSVYHSVPGNDLDASVQFTGSDWRIKTLRLVGDDHHTTITDADNGANRRIDFLELGFNSEMTLISTRVRYIFGWDGDKHVVTLGDQQSGSTFAVNLYATENVLTTGNAFVHSISTGGEGTGKGDTITIGSGGTDSLTTGNRNDTVVTTTGYAMSISTNGGADNVTIGSGGSFSVKTGNGNDTVTTGDGSVDAISTGLGRDTVAIGAGGADLVKTSDGNDTVTTGTGYVQLIHTGNGNDVVEVGSGAGAIVKLGQGDDVVTVNEINPAYGLVIQGGEGKDTIDFSKFTTGVTFTLDSSGIFQNVAAPGGDLTVPAKGYFSEASIENLIGTAKNDHLTGDSGANVLSGRSGADRVFGGSGNDVLKGDAGNDRLFGQLGRDNIQGGKGKDLIDGGKANDTLRGNGGADTFVFGANSGTDRVMDFADGTDILRLVGHTGGFGDLGFADVGGDREITHDNGTILLVGDAGLVLTAADFEFV